MEKIEKTNKSKSDEFIMKAFLLFNPLYLLEVVYI